MVRANNPYIVPTEDQADGSFFVPLPTQRLTVQLPLDTNKVDTVLRPLALWLDFPGAGRANKLDLIAGIQGNISLLPMADAAARWPNDLGPIPETYDLQVTRLRSLKNAANGSGYKFDTNIYIDTLRRDTPQFIPHLHAKITELINAIESSEKMLLRKEAEEREKKCRAPAWWDSVMTEIPSTTPYYELTVKVEQEDHDGYCTDAEVYMCEAETSVMYLPANDWTAKDLNEKNTWDTYLPDHCCCNVMKVTTLMSWERVNA
jgi:hypothetical protein